MNSKQGQGWRYFAAKGENGNGNGPQGRGDDDDVGGNGRTEEEGREACFSAVILAAGETREGSRRAKGGLYPEAQPSIPRKGN